MTYEYSILNTSISIGPNGPNEKLTNFSSVLPNYQENFRAPFREWAEQALPGSRKGVLYTSN